MHMAIEKVKTIKKERPPQICWVMTPEDVKIFDELLRYTRNKHGQRTKITDLVRGMIRLAVKNLDKLDIK
jgi:hypothetical protein